MTISQNEKNSEQCDNIPKEKKAWESLELKVLDIPTATQNGAGRIQPGESLFFYSNS